MGYLRSQILAIPQVNGLFAFRSAGLHRIEGSSELPIKSAVQLATRILTAAKYRLAVDGVSRSCVPEPFEVQRG